MNIAKALTLCRNQRGMTKSQLAAASGVSNSYITLLEKGKRDPNLTTVEKLCGGLRVPSSILLFLASDPDELSGISNELAEKLSLTALRLMNDESTQT